MLPVTSEKWKRDFLYELAAIPDFNYWLSLSTKNNIDLTSKFTRCIRDSAKRIIARYERTDLVRASYHYNTKHLIEFWMWFRTLQERLVRSGEICRDFPVFSVNEGPANGGCEINSLGIEYFEQYYFWKVSDQPCSYRYCAKANRSEHEGEWCKYSHDVFDQLSGRLHALNLYTKDNMTRAYYRFLLQQKELESSCWDDYRIHYFLDRFLYESEDGKSFGAPFEKIFFSNNLDEFEVYLRHCRRTGVDLKYTNIEKYLERQRKYYLALALKIGIAETAFLNNHRHLLCYDPDLKVVVMPELDEQLKSMLHWELVDKAGMMEMDGCPFAKSKGVSGNALIEVYARFDFLMLKLIRRWLDDDYVSRPVMN